jgi:hypothetical protein
LWRVWAAIRSRATPARAALVACPARSEWAVIRSAGQAGGSGAFAEHDGDGLSGDRFAGDRPAAQAGEQSTGLGASVAKPGVEGGDRVGGGLLAVDDGDDLAIGVLIGLGPADSEQDAARLKLDVVQRQGSQLGAAHRGGEAEQDERGIADAQDGAAVDVLADLADVVGAEGRAWRRGAVPMMRRRPRGPGEPLRSASSR